MRVEISHAVDRVEGQVYNYLTYDFRGSDGLIRARAYTDTITEVSILGRLNDDGSIPKAVADFQQTPADASEEARAEAVLRAFAAMDPRGSADYGLVLGYLVDRFREVTVMGPAGPEKIQAEMSA